MKCTVLIVVGLPGCGKTTASNFFKRRFIPIIRMGEVTDEELSRLGLEKTEGHEKYIREILRKKLGLDIYALKVKDKIVQNLDKNFVVIVEGMRSLEEYEYFRHHIPNVKIVYLITDKHIRYNRLSHRNIRPLTLSESKKRDEYEIGSLGLIKLQDLATYTVYNNGNKSEFYTQLKNILTNLSHTSR